jgi:hypothetical protein
MSDVIQQLRALLAADPPLRGIGPEVYVLVCQRCGFEEPLTVAYATQLYRAMNERHWTLIPSQHNARVRGFCSACRPLALRPA